MAVKIGSVKRPPKSMVYVDGKGTVWARKMGGKRTSKKRK